MQQEVIVSNVEYRQLFCLFRCFLQAHAAIVNAQVLDPLAQGGPQTKPYKKTLRSDLSGGPLM